MADNPVVHTTAGDVRGFWREGSAAFLGIPFAEPPVGELRFAAPVPRAPWDGVRDCLEMGPTPQRRQLMAVTAIPEPSIPGEDTLLLNVFTPTPDAGAKLPVYVWIHGGGFTAGSPASPWYDGKAFNRDGVVTVTVSYRLGHIGFGYVDGAPMNRGVLDWLCALEWVRDNIAAFGGDPGQVTIGGQSAGGGAVLTLLACPAAQPLFHRAISHSGAAPDISMGAAKELGRKMAELLGVEATAAAQADIDETVILDAQDKVSGMDQLGNPMDMVRGMVSGEKSMLGFGPTIDDVLIVGKVADQLAAGVGADKPLLIGTVANEFNMITSDPKAKMALKLFPKVKFLTSVGIDKPLAKEYVEAHPGWDTAQVLGQLLTDIMFRAPLTQYCGAHADSFAFDFRWISPKSGMAPHCLDLPFAWDCLDDPHAIAENTGPNPPRSLADAMHADWVRFIKTGDPGWPAFAASHGQGMVFDTPPQVNEVYAIEAKVAGR